MTFSERQIDRRREDTRAGKPSWKRGFTLIECMIYIVVLAVVMGLGFSAFYRFLENWRDLARSSEDILQVLKAGELWRADIRSTVLIILPSEVGFWQSAMGLRYGVFTELQMLKRQQRALRSQRSWESTPGGTCAFDPKQ